MHPPCSSLWFVRCVMRSPTDPRPIFRVMSQITCAPDCGMLAPTHSKAAPVRVRCDWGVRVRVACGGLARKSNVHATCSEGMHAVKRLYTRTLRAATLRGAARTHIRQSKCARARVCMCHCEAITWRHIGCDAIGASASAAARHALAQSALTREDNREEK